jgi:hypothetical protein
LSRQSAEFLRIAGHDIAVNCSYQKSLRIVVVNPAQLVDIASE